VSFIIETGKSTNVTKPEREGARGIGRPKGRKAAKKRPKGPEKAACLRINPSKNWIAGTSTNHQQGGRQEKKRQGRVRKKRSPMTERSTGGGESAPTTALPPVGAAERKKIRGSVGSRTKQRKRKER